MGVQSGSAQARLQDAGDKSVWSRAPIAYRLSGDAEMTAPDQAGWEDARVPEIARINGDFPGARLNAIWETPPGLIGWFSSVDHKEIGLRYIVTAFIFLILGGLEA